MKTPDMVTGHTGVALLIETFRSQGLSRAVNRYVRMTRRRRGYAEATCIETLVALFAAGGDCLDDVRVLSADGGLKRLWDRSAKPSAKSLRAFLNRFIALPLAWRPMRPKRLRFLLLHLCGRLVTHGQRLFLRLARDHPSTMVFIEARRKLALCA